MRRVCFYHAGCPDGFGAAWAAWRAWGPDASYVARGHEDRIRPEDHAGDLVAYVDIAPPNDELRALAGLAEQVVLLDHHVSAQGRYESDPATVNAVEEQGHTVVFDMEQSGAMLAWRWFRPEQEPPPLLRYVQDQDLWHWALPHSEQVNAAIAAYPRRFEVWSELASRPIEELAREGESIVRADKMEIERVLQNAHPLDLDGRMVEAVNATHRRAQVGHALAERKAFGVEWGCVYRVLGDAVNATLYSIGDVDVAEVAIGYGGGGHKNAAGFTVPLKLWLERFV